MRQPRILDVVGAVRAVAPRHDEIRAWWYVPPQRLRLRGDAPASSADKPSIEVVVESDTAPDFDAIARELSRSLAAVPVAVRAFRGEREERHLFRLLSRGDVESARAPEEMPR
jgi:hypothetical protein